MRQTRKNIYDVSRCTISHILELKSPFCSGRFDSSNSVPVAWASCFCFFMPSVPHSQQTTQTVAQQKRAANNTADVLKNHHVSNHRTLHAFASPKEAPVRSALTVLPLLLRRCIWRTYSPAAGCCRCRFFLLLGPSPVRGFLQVGGWMTSPARGGVGQTVQRETASSEKMADGLDQLELAYAAPGAKLTVTENEGRRHDAEFGTHSCN